MPKTCIIAEIGTSHQGDIGRALEMVHAAKESGADTAKFQWVYANEIIHPRTGLVQLPTGAIPLYERFKSLEQGPEFFAVLKETCEKIGLEFLCTPFGIKSAMQLWQLGVKRFKIASPELNHLPLIELMAATGLDLIVSSGVSRLSDIEEAMETISMARKGHMPHLVGLHADTASDLLRQLPAHAHASEEAQLGLNQFGSLGSHHNVTLLHCMTSYPAPEDEYNLLLLRTLRGVFGVQTGISDHSLDPVLVPVVSTILGATIIEKHFTLSNDSDGLDDPIALTPGNFRKMVDAVRLVDQQRPSGRREITGLNSTAVVEADVLEQLDTMGMKLDPQQIRRILGNGVKTLAASERENYGRTNRSVHAAGDLKAGMIIGPQNLSIIRTEKILRPGLHPRYASQIIGHQLSQDVPDGEGIRWLDLVK